MSNPTVDPHYDELARLIIEQQFDDAEALIHEKIDDDRIITTLHSLAEDRTDVLTYTFISYMLLKHETSFWHRAAAVILAESLNQFAHSAHAAYVHIKKAIALNPADWTLKEYAMMLHQHGVITDSEAAKYAKMVLKHDPDNADAKKLLG